VEVRINRDTLYATKGHNTSLSKVSTLQLNQTQWSKLSKHLAEIAVQGVEKEEAQDASFFSADSTEGESQCEI
jgi:hypothetical protein